MSRILLQTTIAHHDDDWNIDRFALLAAELREAGHDVVARDRADGDDQVLCHVDELGFDQVWLMAVDVGDGLSAAEASALRRFHERGGGVLTARDHDRLGSCLLQLGVIGALNEFHDETVDPETMCDDRDNPDIAWPNYHSGANGDYQPVLVEGPVHELLRTPSGRVEWFPAHPHEGLVSAAVPGATVVAQGRSTSTGRRFNLAVSLDGPFGRVVAESTFHHFADYNWDIDCGAPSFVTELPGGEIAADPARLTAFKGYVRNLAAWLHPVAWRGVAASPRITSSSEASNESSVIATLR